MRVGLPEGRAEGELRVSLGSRRRDTLKSATSFPAHPSANTSQTIIASERSIPDITSTSPTGYRNSALILPSLSRPSNPVVMDSPDSPPGTLLDWEEDQVCFWLDKVGYPGHDDQLRGTYNSGINPPTVFRIKLMAGC